jgi:hypothetical protein
MHRSETPDLATCAICGAEIVPARDRAYAAGRDTFLCFACATQRGGTWDELQDRWLEAPVTSGFPLRDD